MTTPGGVRTPPIHCHNSARARPTGFSHRVGAPTTPTVRGSDPSLCPTPNTRESSHLAYKDTPFGVCVCSSPPRYYNLINRQAGCSLNLPPPRAARLIPCLWPWSWAVWSGAVLNVVCTGVSEVVAPASQLWYLVCERSGGERLGEAEEKACDE